MTGDWPDPEVDHDNQDPSDNRWDNRYEADDTYNARNRPLNRNNTSGHNGVSKHKKRWRIVYIDIDNEGRRHQRNFPTKKEAVVAREQ